LYVGNPTFGVTDSDLLQLFEPFGKIESAQVIMDRETGRSRCFAFVEMRHGAEGAIANLNGAQFQGRTLTVNEAKPREANARPSWPNRGGTRGRCRVARQSGEVQRRSLEPKR
jgi:RNA recognition motif-containing protein